jgi:hypothetical protein
MKLTHKHRDIIIAWANGEKIQYKSCEKWFDIEWSPTWEKDVEYRIKPEVIRYRIGLHKNENTYWYVTAKNEEELEELESRTFFKKWITDWIEVEV